MQIDDYLYSKKLYYPLLLKGMKDDKWKLISRQVLGVIWLILSKSIGHNVVVEKKHNEFDNNIVWYVWDAIFVLQCTSNEKLFN